MSSKVVAIVGSYRKGGTIDSAVESVLEGAREKGAQTHIIYLRDQHIEFCTNCRQCTQKPGTERGKCIQQDDLEQILQEIEAGGWNRARLTGQLLERDGHLPQVFGETGGLNLLAVGTKCSYPAQQAATPQGRAGGFVRHAGIPDSYCDWSGKGSAHYGQMSRRKASWQPVDWLGIAGASAATLSPYPEAGAAHGLEAGISYFCLDDTFPGPQMRGTWGTQTYSFSTYLPIRLLAIASSIPLRKLMDSGAE